MSDPALDAAGSSLRVAAVRETLRDTLHVDAAAGKEHLIDAMRGFAALLVAYFHCRQVVWVGMQSFHQTMGHALTPDAIAAWLTLPVAWGSAGVPIFFVISGYCIHRGGAQRLAAQPGYRLPTLNFWARRFARIYPVLLAALILTFVLDSISLHLPPVSHKIRDIGLQAFLVNLFSLQGVAGKTYGSNGALWTLSLEIQFYAVYPLVFALRKRIGMPALVALVALVNAASAWLLERHDLQFFTSYWLSWMLGAWIADAGAMRPAAAFVPVASGAATPRRQPSRLWYAAAAALIVLGCGAFHFGQYGAFQLWATGFACWLYAALGRQAAQAAQAASRGAAARTGDGAPGVALSVLSRFGDFSYSLYLIHLPIFVLLGSLFFRSELQLAIWPSFAFMLAVLPVAWLFYRIVELPAMRWSASLKPRAAKPLATPQGVQR
ncbi:acyltransferase [Paraburkholderia sp. SUR17]|uniref:acyltransferase family protein n=1 Tax=Paraburkholderia sp. SUR17 TaxID=3034358 RepID=UPI002407A8BC|nr:acyltransferase [Paraburkholderia sp. SUR17]WEY40338.1 acyltransferase [Paraburkholderia sp. SUR17]